MNSKERVLAALKRSPTDAVPYTAVPGKAPKKYLFSVNLKNNLHSRGLNGV